MQKAEKNMQFICEHERRCAELLAVKVMQKPQMHLWMILIPIIFVFYLNDLKKYREGKESFVENYLITRKRALEEAMAVVREGRKPDLDKLVQQMPEAAREKLKDLLAVLVDHYLLLLKADGEDYKCLVCSVYKSLHNYSQFTDRLDATESALNLILRPGLEKNVEGAADLVCAIENNSAIIRRSEAKEIFS